MPSIDTNTLAATIPTSLSGAAIDVLYKLALHGGQNDGDLPSKSGMTELIQRGLAYKDYAESITGHSNFITEAGAAYYKHLINQKIAAQLS